MAAGAVFSAVSDCAENLSVRLRARNPPPIRPILIWALAGLAKYLAQLDFENFVFLTTDDLYWKAYLSSLKIADLSTLMTLAVDFSIAYGMARAATERRLTLLMLIILPFWTRFLIGSMRGWG